MLNLDTTRTVLDGSRPNSGRKEKSNVLRQI